MTAAAPSAYTPIFTRSSAPPAALQIRMSVRRKAITELLERIDHSVSPERPEHDVIKSRKSGADRKKRNAEQHEHNIGGNNDAELRHESAEEAVIIQKALYQIVHYLPPKNYINMRQITA